MEYRRFESSLGHVNTERNVYRKVSEITEDEFLAALGPTPQHQIAIFVKLGGDPNDHQYARLSFLTRRLRRRGIPVRTDRRKGVWLEDHPII